MSETLIQVTKQSQQLSPSPFSYQRYPRLFSAAGLVLVALAALVISVSTSAQVAQVPTLHGHIPSVIERTHLLATGQLSDTQQLDLVIGLPLRNQEVLTNLIQQIYDPTSPLYHHYLSMEEFTEKFGPTEEDYQRVISYMEKRGFKVTGTHPNRLLLDVRESVATIEKALHVKMLVYAHPKEKRTFFAPDAEPSLDSPIPILGIGGLDNYEKLRPMNILETNSIGQTAPTPGTGSGPNGAYRGYDFRAAYVPGTTLTGSGQVVGLFEADGYYANDITSYEQQSGLPNVTVQNVLIDGFNGVPDNNLGNLQEVSLDIEMAIAMAPGLSKVLVYECNSTSTMLDTLNRMVTDNLAKQLSSSWFWPSEGVVGLLSTQMFQQMSTQGQTFFQASGDNGAYYTGIAQWAGSPNVTLVGGTVLTTSGPGGSWVSETAWGNTGGGFRPAYSIPVWQQGLSSSANQASSTLRNVPDVSIVATGVWIIYNNGSTSFQNGTSIGAPLWAGFAALVNQQLAAYGQPTIGSTMNPLLYGIGTGANYLSCFHDITTGNNNNGNASYNAVAGYDLCTGLGTPKGVNLINQLSFLPDLNRFSDSLSTSVTYPGGTLAPSVIVTNQYCFGGYAATGPFHIGFYWSTSSNFSGLSPIYEASVAGCPAGGSVTINPSIPISLSTTPGTYYLGYKIDDDAEVIECNEGNDGFYSWTITVASQYTVAASADSGGSISPSGTLTESAGASQSFTATPNSGYSVFHWFLDGALAQTGGANYTLSNIQTSHTVEVSFALVSTTPQLMQLSLSNATFSCILTGSPSTAYVIQISSNLFDWTNRKIVTTANGGWALITEGVGGLNHRFYRATTSLQGQFVLQPSPPDGDDIWTTSVFSYAPSPCGAKPGGGLDDYELRVGGWGDLYYSLLKFDLTGLPTNAASATLYLYCYQTTSNGTPMYLDVITSSWNWKTTGTGCDSNRLWWADRPGSAQWDSSPIANPVQGQWYAVDITTLYTAWQSGTYTNYGVQFRPVNNNNNFNFFYSSDYTNDPALRPKLVITPSP